jgi:hypothetical protein
MLPQGHVSCVSKMPRSKGDPMHTVQTVDPMHTVTGIACVVHCPVPAPNCHRRSTDELIALRRNKTVSCAEAVGLACQIVTCSNSLMCY